MHDGNRRVNTASSYSREKKTKPKKVEEKKYCPDIHNFLLNGYERKILYRFFQKELLWDKLGKIRNKRRK
jgi:hypothetical protein